MKPEIKNIISDMLSDASITTWLDNDCADSVGQINELAMKEYIRLFEIT